MVVPTYGGFVVEFSQYMLLESFHLELQTIVICLDIFGLVGRVVGSLRVQPTYINVHGYVHIVFVDCVTHLYIEQCSMTQPQL